MENSSRIGELEPSLTKRILGLELGIVLMGRALQLEKAELLNLEAWHAERERSLRREWQAAVGGEWTGFGY